VPFLACVVYDKLASALSMRPATSERILHELRIVQLVSAALMVLGIVLGSSLTTGIFSYSRYADLVTPDSTRLWFAPGYPLFLHLTHPSYVLFSFGALSLLLTVVFEAVDLNSRRGRGSEIFSVFGKYSLTIYLLNPIAVFFPFPISLEGFIILFSTATSLTIAGTYVWEKHWEGKYSVDWLIRKFVSTNISVLLATLPLINQTRKQKGTIFPA
jgi:hypothetical protein